VQQTVDLKEAAMSVQPNPAISWLSTLAAPEPPETYLLSQAGKLLRANGQLHPPYDPRKALPTSVKEIEVTALSRDGMLLPVQGGFIMKLNSQRPPVRQRFTCAHEIGHTFFYDMSGARPWRPPQSLSSNWVEEGLCYQFAEEMIMPVSNMIEMAAPLTPTLKNFLQIRKTFGASTEALARRIARLNIWRCILVLWAIEGNPPAQPKTVCKHDDYDYFSLNWDTLASMGSAALRVAVAPWQIKLSLVAGVELFKRGGRRETWRVETIRLSPEPRCSLLVLIAPET
jgi:hypothetical protein